MGPAPEKGFGPSKSWKKHASIADTGAPIVAACVSCIPYRRVPPRACPRITTAT